MDKPEVVKYVLLSFANDNIGIVDAILLTYCSIIQNKNILTFNEKIKSIFRTKIAFFSITQ